MSSEIPGSPHYRHHFGPCNRCGWTKVVSRVSRRSAKQLGMISQASRVCDECLQDLRGIQTLPTQVVTRESAYRRTPVRSVVA